ncbi:MAG: hypothetical protein ABI895_27245 [Deltaproteobacteria bacterium]
MNLRLSFSLVAAVAGTLACSDDGGKPRDDTSAGGSAGQAQVGNAGSSAGGGSSGSNGSSGSGNLGTSGAGGGGSGSNLGAALTIAAGETPATATVVDETGSTGINGGASVAKSVQGTFDPAFVDAKLCAHGSTAQVVGGNYTDAWGGLIGVDLYRGAPPNAAGADAGAGGDAGPPVLATVQPWTPGNVDGFSFKIDGPSMPLSLRFQGTPTGSIPADDHFCNNVMVGTAGGTFNVKFSEIVRDCFNATPGAAMFADAAGYTQLQNINWQVSASDVIAFPFDFCVSEIKPILKN